MSGVSDHHTGSSVKPPPPPAFSVRLKGDGARKALGMAWHRCWLSSLLGKGWDDAGGRRACTLTCEAASERTVLAGEFPSSQTKASSPALRSPRPSSWGHTSVRNFQGTPVCRVKEKPLAGFPDAVQCGPTGMSPFIPLIPLYNRAVLKSVGLNPSGHSLCDCGIHLPSLCPGFPICQARGKQYLLHFQSPLPPPNGSHPPPPPALARGPTPSVLFFSSPCLRSWLFISLSNPCSWVGRSLDFPMLEFGTCTQ